MSPEDLAMLRESYELLAESRWGIGGGDAALSLSYGQRRKRLMDQLRDRIEELNHVV